MVTRRTLIKGAAAMPLAGVLATHLPSVSAQQATIKVGSKNFPEALIIGELYAQALEAAGFGVERSLNLGGTVVAHQALLNGDIDLYPEYTGTGLLVVLEKTVADATGGAMATPAAATPMTTAGSPFGAVDQAVYDYVKTQYESQFSLTWLDQSPMNNTQALAVKRAFSEENGITTISQLWAYGQENELTISAPVDFEEREDGLAGLVATYGEAKVSVNGVDPGIKYQALVDDDANVVLAFSTDAEIAFYDLVVLQDDLGLWPPYHVAPVVRMDTLAANSGIAQALNAVSPLLTSEEMIRLNGLVVGDEKQEPADVARDFLTQNGIVSG